MFEKLNSARGRGQLLAIITSVHDRAQTLLARRIFNVADLGVLWGLCVCVFYIRTDMS
jgi:hypothetical protein